MNTQLVNSIIQVVRALSPEEQQTLIETLNRLSKDLPLQGEVHPKSDEETPTAPRLVSLDSEAWGVWHSLGDDATPGTLDNTSIHHDRYLYPDTQQRPG